MNSPQASLTFAVLALLLFLELSGTNLMPAARAATSRTVEVTVRQFAFEPGRIEVNQGDVVTFRITSADVTHGFYVDGYGVNVKVLPGEEVIVTIVADKPGKFKIRCSVTCGPLHPFTIGELIVTQNGINPVFVGSTAGLGITGLLTIFYLSRRRD